MWDVKMACCSNAYYLNFAYTRAYISNMSSNVFVLFLFCFCFQKRLNISQTLKLHDDMVVSENPVFSQDSIISQLNVSVDTTTNYKYVFVFHTMDNKICKRHVKPRFKGRCIIWFKSSCAPINKINYHVCLHMRVFGYGQLFYIWLYVIWICNNMSLPIMILHIITYYHIYCSKWLVSG